MGILPPRKDRLIDDVIHFTEQACILVALTFALAHADLVARQLRRGRSTRGSFAALLVFMGTALLVEVVAQRHAPAGAQTVAACAAGLLAGPWVGGTVGVGAVLLALALPMTESAPGLAAVFGGLAGGMIRRVWPAWGQRPLVGFILGLTASLGRHAIAAALVRTGSTAGLGVYDATLNGLGVALVLAVVAEVRAREDEARAASLAEIRALQARMHPHFLFNAMNSIAALSVLAPESVPVAISRLAQFLRWSFDWHDRPTVTLREELEVVDAYLDVEALRLGNRLVVERRVDSEVVEATVPPLSIQPLVENAVRHGLQPCAEGGRILLEACAEGTSLVIIVADTGMGIIQASTMRPASPNDDGAAHALTLLERRLRQIYDGTASLNVCGRPGGGTTVTLRLPLEVPRPPGSRFMIRVVVVEDESLARRYLNRLLVETGKVEVVGEASDGQEGFRLCVGAAPDAVFLDIQIPGPDGLSLAARLLTLPRPPLVVFVTAFAGHAIDAFKVEAVDYLLKPIDVDQVLRAVRRLEHRLGPLLRASAGDGLSGDRLPVRSPGEEVVCLLARRDILAVLRRGRRTWVHTATGEIPTHYPLKALADWLGGPPFLLLARDSVVNMDAVAEVRHLGDRRYRVHMADRCQSVVAVSRSGAARLAELLKPPV